ncbi:MAG: polymer-forming cytoskeletal protein [Lachnospiraceae bacterium]|jgi:cytoskeletal protein CcmA (bactofilin family)|nr:polymer-forming cytoskeletal protein [Lachnospiraceae bacterium]
MSFFKDFKDDLFQAVNDILPPEGEGQEAGANSQEVHPEMVVNTLEQEVDVQSELKKLEGLFEKVGEPANRMEEAPIGPELEESGSDMGEVGVEIVAEEQEGESALGVDIAANMETADTFASDGRLSEAASKETTVVTEGTYLKGDLETTGSLELRGKIDGNVQCNGKMTITGSLKGDTVSAEFFADSAKVEGEVSASGTVKIGLGSVVVGNITATSAVVAGAVKGDIDVQGPVVVDTSAVIKGNIKSRSVQINNGAVIEGFCSQCYADVDMDSLFKEG